MGSQGPGGRTRDKALGETPPGPCLPRPPSCGRIVTAERMQQFGLFLLLKKKKKVIFLFSTSPSSSPLISLIRGDFLMRSGGASGRRPICHLLRWLSCIDYREPGQTPRCLSCFVYHHIEEALLLHDWPGFEDMPAVGLLVGRIEQNWKDKTGFSGTCYLHRSELQVGCSTFIQYTSPTVTNRLPPSCRERGEGVCGTCWKLPEDGKCINCPSGVFFPLLNELYRKPHLIDCPQCEINLFPEFRTNYP